MIEHRGYEIHTSQTDAGWTSTVYWERDIVAQYGPRRLEVQVIRLAKDAIDAALEPVKSDVTLDVQNGYSDFIIRVGGKQQHG